MFFALFSDTSYSPVKPPAQSAMFLTVMGYVERMPEKPSPYNYRFKFIIKTQFPSSILKIPTNNSVLHFLTSGLYAFTNIRYVWNDYYFRTMSKFGSYLKTKSFRLNLLGAVGTVVGIVLIAFFSLGFYTRHGEGIPVPSVKDMSIDRAMELLKDQGFGYQIDSIYVPGNAPGTVVEQDPDAGTNVKVN